MFMHLLLKSLEAGEVLQVASCYSSVGDVTLFFFFLFSQLLRVFVTPRKSVAVH